MNIEQKIVEKLFRCRAIRPYLQSSNLAGENEKIKFIVAQKKEYLELRVIVDSVRLGVVVRGDLVVAGVRCDVCRDVVYGRSGHSDLADSRHELDAVLKGRVVVLAVLLHVPTVNNNFNTINYKR